MVTPRAFTLIELLVVVTIIVILLALLVPAMDGAIYQAELTQCAARQKTIGTMFHLYTTDHKRRYPTNLNPRHSQPWAQPDFLGMESDATRDIRPIIWPGYISKLDMLLCPLSGGISLGYQENNTDTRVSGNYLLYAGWQYPRQVGEKTGKGMLKFGDTLEYTDYQTQAPEQSKTLLMDNHISFRVQRPPQSVIGSHPSRTQELRQKVQMNQDMNDTSGVGGVIPAISVPGVGTQQTYSLWIGGTMPKVDLNTTSNDLSVVRYNAVERYDTRFRPAQVHADYTGDQSVHIYLPGN